MRTTNSGCKARSSNRRCPFKNIPCRTADCAQDWSAHHRKCRIRSASSRRWASICCCCNSARNWRKWKDSATASSVRGLESTLSAPIVTPGPWGEPLLHGQPGVGQIFSMRSRKTPYWLSGDQKQVVRGLRARGAGPTWFCDGDGAARPILDRAGIPSECIVDVKDHRLLPGEHATEQWRRFAQIMPRAAPAAAHRADIDAIAPGCYLEVAQSQRVELAAGIEARDLADP